MGKNSFHDIHRNMTRWVGNIHCAIDFFTEMCNWAFQNNIGNMETKFKYINSGLRNDEWKQISFQIEALQNAAWMRSETRSTEINEL